MARDDWRIRIVVPEGQSTGLLARLGLQLGAEAQDLAEELREHRLVVSTDDLEHEVFVYAETRPAAEQARSVVQAELAELGWDAEVGPVERWLPDEDRWDNEAPGPDVEEEALGRGFAPWEVRVETKTHGEAQALAERLEAEGRPVVRRWRYVLVGAASREEADALARELHGEAEPGSELVYEVLPQNPFAIFGGLGGAGTPL